MNNYQINKVDNQYYELYNLTFENGDNHYYYEKKDNQFVNKVYIIIGELNIPNILLEHNIYIFYKDLSGIPDMIKALNNEFNNLEFVFVTNNEKYPKELITITDSLGDSGKIISLKEYLKIHKPTPKPFSHNPQYSDYELEKNPFIKKEQDQTNDRDICLDKDYIQYNGYNEKLINDNVKNIVNIKKSSGDKNG